MQFLYFVNVISPLRLNKKKYQKKICSNLPLQMTSEKNCATLEMEKKSSKTIMGLLFFYNDG